MQQTNARNEELCEQIEGTDVKRGQMRAEISCTIPEDQSGLGGRWEEGSCQGKRNHRTARKNEGVGPTDECGSKRAGRDGGGGC